jgi:hypothetical protein
MFGAKQSLELFSSLALLCDLSGGSFPKSQEKSA